VGFQAELTGRSDVNLGDGSRVMGGRMARRFPSTVAYLNLSSVFFFKISFFPAILNFILREITFSGLKTLRFFRHEKVKPFEFTESEAQ
jgi:hypothetical protein